MSRAWSEHAEAREELIAESDRLPPDIADKLIDHVETAIDDILSSPDAWPIVHYWDELPVVRWRAVKPFRIRVVYYVVNEGVRVLAYAHEAREPGYWRHRISAPPGRASA